MGASSHHHCWGRGLLGIYCAKEKKAYLKKGREESSLTFVLDRYSTTTTFIIKREASFKKKKK